MALGFKKKQEFKGAGPGTFSAGRATYGKQQRAIHETIEHSIEQAQMNPMSMNAIGMIRYSPARFFPAVTEVRDRIGEESYTMNPRQYARRQSILRQIDIVLEGWPERAGELFLRHMEPLLRELESLVLEVDQSTGDRIEKARNWRYLGNAYFDYSGGVDPGRLELATDAYKRAELLLVGIENPTERMKLSYSFAQALFGLSRRSNFWMVEEARQKYLQALEIARREMPEAVEPIRTALDASDQVLDLLKVRKEIYRQIAELKRRENAAESNESDLSLLIPQETDLFEMLIANYHGTSKFSPMVATAQHGIERLIRCI